jgi:hypothetical protein
MGQSLRCRTGHAVPCQIPVLDSNKGRMRSEVKRCLFLVCEAFLSGSPPQ